MSRLVLCTTLIASILNRVACSPAHVFDFGDNGIQKREPQNAQTKTVNVTTTSISIVTKCPTGTVNTTTATTNSSATSSTRKSTITATTTTSTSTSTTKPSDEPSYDGCTYNVEGAGKFKNKKVFTFFQPGLPDGLYASKYTVYDTYGNLPYNHKFETSNVYSDGDFLNLKVQGTNNPSTLPEKAISCAEVVTTENNILYASVRTNAIFSTVPGTCHGSQILVFDSQ